MDTRTKRGKAIIGIAMAAIMVASLMAMVGSVSAYSNGGEYNIIKKDGGATVQPVLIGQDVIFPENEGWELGKVTIYRVKDDAVVWTKSAGDDNILTISGDDWKKEGAYYVNYDEANKEREAQLSFSDPDMPLTLKVGTKEVSSIAMNTVIKIDTAGINLFDQDRVDLIIVGPDGQIKYDEENDQRFTNISVNDPTEEWTLKKYGERLVTKGWTIGDYTFQVKTKSANACGLDAASAVKDLHVIKEAIEIAADTTSTIELEQVTLTVTGVSGDVINVTGDSKNVIFKAGIMDTPLSAKDHPSWFEDKIDADGKRQYAVEFNDTGSFTIKATIKGPAGTGRVGNYEEVDITVLEKGVEFDLPTSVVIGDRITIKGTATSGTYVSVYIDDVLYRELQDLVIDNGEFSKEVTTTSVGMSVPGSVRLKAWIDCECKVPAGAASTTEEPTRTADGETAILLTMPELKAELSQETVALEDDFTVKGTAPGSRQVTILCVTPKGGGGTSLLDKGVKGVAEAKASVSTTDYTFVKKLTVQEDASTGYYDIYVLSPGMDEEWDMTGEKDLLAALNKKYGISSLTSGIIQTKTQEEIYNILDDMIHAAGSDDLMWRGKVKVEQAYVKLDPTADVGIGEPLVVTGTSNRKDGYPIVVTCKGPVELDPQTVKLENGTFSVTFDTADAKVGTYTVKADDGDGHTDEATIEITAAVPTPTPVVSPTPTPVVSPTPPPVTPTPSPTPTPATPTPKPPGFEAVFAIAGLLAIAYLVLRRRK
ncbi:MAG: PGF-CTERM sorting domain-containing protein [Methanophagales archaeon]|nr:PGF-CTERM sorting domain-containing protein [Methanophagales archaeon]